MSPFSNQLSIVKNFIYQAVAAISRLSPLEETAYYIYCAAG